MPIAMSAVRMRPTADGSVRSSARSSPRPPAPPRTPETCSPSLPTSSRQQRFELLFVEDAQLQLLRLLELRTGARPCDHVVGLCAHAADRLAAELAHDALGIRAAHRLERAG